MKQEEKDFMLAMYAAHLVQNDGENIFPGHDLVEAFAERVSNPIPRKRMWYWMEKWSNKSYWDYGNSCRSGWFTLKGLDKVEELMREATNNAEFKLDRGRYDKRFQRLFGMWYSLYLEEQLCE